MVQRPLEWPLLVLGRPGDQPLQILALGWVADDANMISAEGVWTLTFLLKWLSLWSLAYVFLTIQTKFQFFNGFCLWSLAYVFLTTQIKLQVFNDFFLQSCFQQL